MTNEIRTPTLWTSLRAPGRALARALRRAGPAAAAAVLLCTAATEASAQVEEGIGLAVTPTAERLSWSDDLALDEAWYYGGRASLSFGRFVALQGYFLQGDDVEVAPGEIGTLDRARRLGGDVVFTFANWDLTPFLRAGAGVSQFRIPEGAENEILTGTGAAGIRFDLFDRLQTEVFAQDVVFRASGLSPLVEPGAIDEEETETFHNFSLGAGVNLYLGGEMDQAPTDRAFEDGLRGVASPVEVFGGSLGWDDELGLADFSVAGARFGLDFGPFVGLHGYYFGSAEEGFDDFTSYFGWGAEGRFNLTRSDEPFTPFLVLGGGRIHFPDSIAGAAGFEDDRKKWNAVLGGGLGYNVSDRFRLEASARDFMLSRSDPDDVTAPDQIQHNWMISGGLRLAVGGETPEPPRPTPPDVPGLALDTTPTPAEPETPTAAGRRMEAPPGEAGHMQEIHREIRAVRAEVDSLRQEIRQAGPATAARQRPAEGDPEEEGRAPPTQTEPRQATAPGDTTATTRDAPERAASLFQLPVLADGEIYIRFGESGTFERLGALPGADTLGGARRQTLMPRRQQPPASAEGEATPMADSIRALAENLQAALDAMDARERQTPDTAGAARAEAQDRPPVTRRQMRRAEPAPAGELGAEVDALRREVSRLQAELDALRAGRDREAPEPDREEELRGVERLEARIDRRLEALREELEALRQEERRAPPAEPETPEAGAAPRGVLRGEPMAIHGLSPFAGPSLDEPHQLLLGAKADLGSALGGDGRFVPEVILGVTDEFTWNVNAHVEWPLRFLDLGGVEPYAGGGVGILDRGDLELLVPNVVAGASYTWRGYDLFGGLQGLDFFDDTRLVFGIHTGPLTIRGSDRAEEETRVQRRTGEPPEAAAAGEAARREILALEGAPGVRDVRRVDEGVTVVLGGDDAFSSGRADMAEDVRFTLGRLADLLLRHRDLMVAVEGHADERGSPEANDRLSRQRAEGVKSTLEGMGVPSGRIAATGLGASRPVADNDTAEGRAANRRVEIRILGFE